MGHFYLFKNDRPWCLSQPGSLGEAAAAAGARALLDPCKVVLDRNRGRPHRVEMRQRLGGPLRKCMFHLHGSQIVVRLDDALIDSFKQLI